MELDQRVKCASKSIKDGYLKSCREADSVRARFTGGSCAAASWEEDMRKICGTGDPALKPSCVTFKRKLGICIKNIDDGCKT